MWNVSNSWGKVCKWCAQNISNNIIINSQNSTPLNMSNKVAEGGGLEMEHSFYHTVDVNLVLDIVTMYSARFIPTLPKHKTLSVLCPLEFYT